MIAVIKIMIIKRKEGVRERKMWRGRARGRKA